MKKFNYTFDPRCGINILEKKRIGDNEFFMRGNAKDMEVGDIMTFYNEPILICRSVQTRDSKGVFVPNEKRINNYFEGTFEICTDFDIEITDDVELENQEQ